MVRPSLILSGHIFMVFLLGGLVYVNMLGKDFIIINSANVAHDLMDRRSTIYSERPHIAANKLYVTWLVESRGRNGLTRAHRFGMDFNSGLLPYGNKWRLHRKLFNTALNKGTARQYQPIAISKARQLIENLLDMPEDYDHHYRTCVIYLAYLYKGFA